jgi:hypothetical protein
MSPRLGAAIALGALLLANPLAGAAQGGDLEREVAFETFLQSVAAQAMSRLCVRGIASYRARFEHVFPLWRDKHRELIAVGDAVFQQEKAKPDLRPEYRTKLAEVDRVRAGLATPAEESGPLVIDNRVRERCERTLEDLNKGLN